MDYAELEDENINLQKQVSQLKQSQVEFEGRKLVSGKNTIICQMLTFHKFGWKIMKMMIKNILLDLSKIFQSHQGRLFTVLRDHLNYWYIWMNL